MRKLSLSLPLAIAALGLVGPATAPAATTVSVKGVSASGPDKYDKSFVTKIGPSSAKTVLVLMPGYAGGAGDFTKVGEDIVDEVPGLQVWAVDRRSQALEDTSMFEKGVKGQATPEQVFQYYLGWLENPAQPGPRFSPPSNDSLKFMSEWGLPTAIGDLHNVILSARKQGKRVILGGHSLGASMTTIYAAWDFKGKPGSSFVDGLVLIDGGTLGTFAKVQSPTELDKELKEVREKPFADLVGLGLPWAQGVFTHVGGLFAAKEPTAPGRFDTFSLLPPQFKPPVPTTNRGFLGYVFDQTTSPKSLGLIQIRAGGLAPSGTPRDWVDGEVTPIARLAEFWADNPVNGIEWYFPQRLALDTDAAHNLNRTKQTDRLKLRTWHLKDVDKPLYAFQTDLTDGRVIRGAKRFIAKSKVKRSTLVDRGSTTSHLDPLTAAPATNDFLKTVVPFLKRTLRDRPSS